MISLPLMPSANRAMTVATGIRSPLMQSAPPILAGSTVELELLLDLSIISLAAMSVGMLISVCARTLTQAVSLATVTAICQVALNGITLNMSSWPKAALGLLVPARWGLAATASSVNLRSLAPSTTDRLWRHATGQWAFDVAVIAVMTLAAVITTIIRLRRRLNRPDTNH